MTQQMVRVMPAATRCRVPGETGVWVFILTEMMIFAALFGVIVWGRAHNPGMFVDGQALLSQPLGLINTAVLIFGSVSVVLALDAAQTDQFRRASRWLTAAIACGALFAAIKGAEYGLTLHHGLWIHTNLFWMLFFAITGAHLMHVLVGATALGLMRRRTTKGLAGLHDRELFESATSYWHMVDLLWLVLFPLFYLVN